ncbi:hypothetical protein J6590_012640 [Homalodisca vitripennis]|nr:hypothetical protein J6590_012640 [Homalodisca vitripennis]
MSGFIETKAELNFPLLFSLCGGLGDGGGGDGWGGWGSPFGFYPVFAGELVRQILIRKTSHKKIRNDDGSPGISVYRGEYLKKT